MAVLGNRMVHALVCALAFALTAAGAQADTTPWPLTPNSLATNGSITGMATVGNSVFVTGDFNQIGRFTGSGVALDPTTGAVNQSFPAVNGQISYVLASADGGWYIGGDFTEVGGVPRSGVAKLEPNGTLNAAFAPTTNGLVDALALDGGTLFLAGSFNTVDGSNRQGLAAVDAQTGALLPFDAHETGTATELCFLPASGSDPAVLYAGMGEVLALDPVTGDPIPGFNSDIDDDIEALAVDNQHLYVGGPGLVALDPMTGVLDPDFDPNPVGLNGMSKLTGDVYSIVPQPGRILVGGDFNALGGASGPLVALDPTTGLADREFRPQIDGSIYDMDQSGNTLWIGGSLSSVDGASVSNATAIDATTGARANDIAPDFGAQVNGIRVGDGSVYAGGEFYIVNASPSDGFAEVQASSGALDPSFDPRAPSSQTLTGGGDRLIASQIQFQGYHPHERKHPFRPSASQVEVLDPATGRPAAGFPRQRVKNLSGVAVSSGSLFLAQRIGNAARFPANLITVWNIRTGHLQHQYRLPLPGYVSQLTFASGKLYVAGSFKRTRPSGQPANLAILAIDPSTGKLDSGFDPHANGPVYTLAGDGGRLYFGGLFRVVQGAHRRGLAAVNLSDGVLDHGFKPSIGADNVSQLTALPLDLLLQSPFRLFFLSYGTGAFDPLGAGGLPTDHVEAAAPIPGGLLVAASVATPLEGDSDDDLDYIRTITR